MRTNERFTWIPIHQETAKKIIETPISQQELLETLQAMADEGLKVIKLEDQNAAGESFPLAVIDPITFFANFNRGITVKNRQQNWAFLKERWKLESDVPSDFDGIPVYHNTASWLFPYERARSPEHIRMLWELSGQAVRGGLEAIDGALFDKCLRLRDVAIASLTIGLYWMNPHAFLPADKKTIAYARSLGISSPPVDFATYKDWIAAVTEATAADLPTISATADSPGFRNRETFSIPQARLSDLWKRFKAKYPDFVDFTQPGDGFVNDEITYKRALFTKFDEELGAARLQAMVTNGQGDEAVAQLSRTLASNIVAFQSWNTALGNTSEEKCAIISKFIAATKREYSGPATTQPIFAAYEQCKAKPSWDVLGMMLWVLRPLDYFPIKISYYRRLARNLGYNLPNGRPTPETLDAVIRFGRVFRNALKPQKPRDWVDVQSFMWVVSSEIDGISIAAPLGEIFRSAKEADAALSLIRWALIELGVSPQDYANDTRIALTLPEYSGPRKIRLNFGNWLILGFWAKHEMGRLEFVCLKDAIPPSAYLPPESMFADQIDGEVFSIVYCDPEFGFDAGSKEREIFRRSLASVRERFANWNGSPWRRLHQAELLKLAFDEARRKQVIEALFDSDDGEEPEDPAGNEATPYSRQDALRGLFLSEEKFDQILAALKEKKNVVLQGAPGVGKTFVAKRLAYALIGARDNSRVEMIQFHQSYSYEDFIQGYRPTDGGLFKIKAGIFYQFCRRAQKFETEDKPFVFIVDEINRGNLSKIFGELMMLLEPDKRGRDFSIPLTYSEDSSERFYIPSNVYLLGMMNTADRSLAMVDYALRRRFRFVTLDPEFESQRFADHLHNKGVPKAVSSMIIRRMTELNKVIAEDIKNLGPGYRIGHSYFCPIDGIKPDEEWYRRVIRTEILPLVYEYWFDDPQKVADIEAKLLESWQV